MSIQGTNLITRHRDAIRILIDYRTGIDSFNLYWSTNFAGPFVLFGSVANTYALESQIRGKIFYGFIPSTIGWNNDNTNYLKLTPVIGGIEGAFEGPMIVPPVRDHIVDKSVNILGFDSVENRFINIAVDSAGKIKI